ncbi:MAG: Na(+)-translocating NADH-quinone reductase subunit A [Bacteroidales bacterium]|nr:Na(+)-translocating NADH-quinone reductase subunit A [Bacteroidales bacterium]
MNTIKIKKGLNICIPGTAEKRVSDMHLQGCFAVKPTDYVGVAPRLLVAEGTEVQAGTALIEDKGNAAARFVSPVSGTVKAIVRGEKRALLAVVVEADGEQKSIRFDTDATAADGIRKTMIESGLWTLLKQRPFGIIPQGDAQPKAVFISAFDSSPLPVDLPFMLEGRKEDFQAGIDILHTLAGTVHLSLQAGKENSFLGSIKNAEIHYFDGPHPAGLVGTQIAAIDPINKGETVWTVNAQDVATIGRLFTTGVYNPERLVALCGPVVEKPHYLRTLAGASIEAESGKRKAKRVRFISGDVLSGTTIAADGFISAACDKVSVLPEGNYYDFLGWLRPNFKKFSFSRTFLSGFFKRKAESGKQRAFTFNFDTGRHGSVRPLFVTGEFEKLVPMDIYPMQLIKACIAGDIEQMENLGIYEVEPEDLALCEFADTSKTEIQAAVRAGLEKIRKES